MKYMEKSGTRRLVQLALLVAITLVMAFTPLGYFRTPLLSVSFLTVPVAIGAIVLGPGAGALITKGTVIPPNSLVLGSPAKVVKDLGPESADNNRKWAEKYVKVATRYTERVINPGF